MRKHVPLIIIMVSIGASVTFAYLTLNADGRQTGLVADHAEHDFGTVKPGEMSHTFTLTNRTKHRIQFQEIAKSCGCADIRLAAQHLEPGGSAEVKCVVNAAGRRGRFRASFKIIYAEGIGRQAPVRALACAVTADIEAVVSMEPPDLEFALGRSESKRIQVRCTQPQARVTRVGSDHAAIRALLSEDGATMEVAFDGSRWVDGEGTASILVETTWEPEKSFRVPVYILNFPKANPQQHATKRRSLE